MLYHFRFFRCNSIRDNDKSLRQKVMGTRKSWQDKRIDAINRKIKKGIAKGWSAQNLTECYIEEHWRICNSNAKSKREYKLEP